MTLFSKIFHINLLILLGLYFNSAPVAWLAYGTFAEKAFASHCMNPGKPKCHGKCQVIQVANGGAKSTNAQAPNFHFSQIQPTLLPGKITQTAPKFGRISFHSFILTPTPSGFLQSPFHPPKELS